MDAKKLNVSALNNVQDDKKSTPDTYKQIPENDMEEYEVENKQMDGALEKMLPTKNDEGNLQNVEIKFVKDKQNGEAKLNISDPKSEFVGLSKEELMRFANDPFWVKLRWILFVCFWLLWAGMLIGAVLIIVAAPKCVAPEPRTWWELGPIVDAVPHDIDADSLSTLKAQGVEGVIVDWPRDAYDSSPETVRSIVGSLLARSRAADLNAIVDLDAGVSERWFELSEGKDDAYVHYYIWADPKASGGDSTNSTTTQSPPNNWLTPRNRSAWIYSTVRQQFYLTDARGRPRLNMREPRVVDEFVAAARRFVGAGFEGVRLKLAVDLLVDRELRDEIFSYVPGYVHTDYGFYEHKRTAYVAEIGALLTSTWRDAVKNGTTTRLFAVADDLRTLEPFKSNGTLTIDLPMHSRRFVDRLVDGIDGRTRSADAVKTDLDAAYRVVEDNWPLWKINQSKSSLPDDVVNHVVFLLKGAAIVDRNRTVDKELLEFRKENQAITYGDLQTYSISNGSVFGFTRVTAGNPGCLVVVNLLDERLRVDLTKDVPLLNEDVTVQFLSKNYNETDVAAKLKIRANDLPISPLSSMVLSYVPKKDE